MDYLSKYVLNNLIQFENDDVIGNTWSYLFYFSLIMVLNAFLLLGAPSDINFTFLILVFLSSFAGVSFLAYLLHAAMTILEDKIHIYKALATVTIGSLTFSVGLLFYALIGLVNVTIPEVTVLLTLAQYLVLVVTLVMTLTSSIRVAEDLYKTRLLNVVISILTVYLGVVLGFRTILADTVMDFLRIFI